MWTNSEWVKDLAHAEREAYDIISGFLDCAGHNLTAVKRGLLCHFFVALPVVVGEAFTFHNIKDIFKRTMLEPFLPFEILSLSSAHAGFSHEEKERYKEALVPLSIVARGKGGHLDVSDVEHLMTEWDREHPPRGVDTATWLRPFRDITSEGERMIRARKFAEQQLQAVEAREKRDAAEFFASIRKLPASHEGSNEMG
jgi:hypothetical protein